MRALAGCARDFLIAGPPAVPSKIRRVPFDVDVCGPVDCAPLGTVKSNAAKMINVCTAVFIVPVLLILDMDGLPAVILLFVSVKRSSDEGVPSPQVGAKRN